MKDVVSTLRQQPSSTVESSPRQRPLWHRLVSWLRSRFEIPYGYEDEHGFHYGIEPTPGARVDQTTVVPRVFTDRASDVIPSPCPVPITDTEVVEEEHHHPAGG